MLKLVAAATTGAVLTVGARYLWAFVAEHSNTQIHQVNP